MINCTRCLHAEYCRNKDNDEPLAFMIRDEVCVNYKSSIVSKEFMIRLYIIEEQEEHLSMHSRVEALQIPRRGYNVDIGGYTVWLPESAIM